MSDTGGFFMNNFVFKNPTKLIFGRDMVQRIGEEVKNSGIKKVLLLYGRGSIYKNGVYEATVKTLKEYGIEFVEFSEINANPELSKVYECIQVLKKENLQGIVAIGGGSVIDTAKAAAVGARYEGDIWKLFEDKRGIKEAIPIFTVLTISSAGSEMNPCCIITNEDKNKKMAFTSDFIYPKVSIVDPATQFALSKEETVNNAINVMSYVLELYFEEIKSTDVMDEVLEGILRAIIKHVQVLINDPDNYNSRAELALCAVLTTNGYYSIESKGCLLVSHQLEHPLSIFYDIAPGEGLSIVFPNWMKYVYKYNIRKFVRFADKIFRIEQGTEDERVLKAIELLRDFYRSLGAPVSLKEVGVRYEDLAKLAANAVELGNAGTIWVLDKEDILQIYKLSYE